MEAKGDRFHSHTSSAVSSGFRQAPYTQGLSSKLWKVISLSDAQWQRRFLVHLRLPNWRQPLAPAAEITKHALPPHIADSTPVERSTLEESPPYEESPHVTADPFVMTATHALPPPPPHIADVTPVERSTLKESPPLSGWPHATADPSVMTATHAASPHIADSTPVEGATLEKSPP